MDQEEYILLANIEGEESSRVCGRTSFRAVAVAWAAGDGHVAHVVPLDGKLLLTGYQHTDFFVDEDY